MAKIIDINDGINPYGIYGIIFNQEVISHCYPRRTQEIINLIQNKLLNV